jgi:hypothetical protein
MFTTKFNETDVRLIGEIDVTIDFLTDKVSWKPQTSLIAHSNVNFKTIFTLISAICRMKML